MRHIAYGRRGATLIYGCCITVVLVGIRSCTSSDVSTIYIVCCEWERRTIGGARVMCLTCQRWEMQSISEYEGESRGRDLSRC